MDLNIPPGGLLPVVVQDATDGSVLMVAYMNQEALDATRATGLMHYWSRSRDTLWRKGETSGHTQRLVRLVPDCDGDCLLATVVPEGPACHTGQTTCFGDGQPGILGELQAVLRDRRASPTQGSYSSTLFRDETLRLKKVVEEAGEVVIAAQGQGDEALAAEAADLLFHLMVVLEARGVALRRVLEELRRRRR